MNSITIKPSLYPFKVRHGIMGVAGTVLVAMHLIELFSGNLPDLWFFYIPIGLYLMVQEFGAFFGYFNMRYPSIKIGRRAVEAKGNPWPRLILLDQVRTLDLSRGKIQATYKISGRKERVRVPYSLRGKEKFETLKNALETRCKEAGVEFSVA